MTTYIPNLSVYSPPPQTVWSSASLSLESRFPMRVFYWSWCIYFVPDPTPAAPVQPWYMPDPRCSMSPRSTPYTRRTGFPLSGPFHSFANLKYLLICKYSMKRGSHQIFHNSRKFLYEFWLNQSKKEFLKNNLDIEIYIDNVLLWFFLSVRLKYYLYHICINEKHQFLERWANCKFSTKSDERLAFFCSEWFGRQF